MAGGDTRWTPDLLKEHYDDRLNKTDAELIRKFEGFPQEYATNVQVNALRTVVEDIRTDHVHRRELDEIKTQLHESTGRRSATVIAISVIVSLMAVGMGLIVKNGITHSQISQQIQHEAPWLGDRPDVERRLNVLERDNEGLRVRLAQMQQLDRFFCRTRTPTLPAC